MQIETQFLAVFKSNEISFSPLAGIMQIETKRSGRKDAFGKVSVPLRGLCKLKQLLSWATPCTRHGFSPLAGIMQIETFNPINC